MKNLLMDLSLAYAAGSVGGLINALVVWVLGVRAITGALGVNVAPALLVKSPICGTQPIRMRDRIWEPHCLLAEPSVSPTPFPLIDSF
jgi:hypothetical protein